jgi:hypothetical protein
VAIGKSWTYGVPILCGAAALSLFLNLPREFGAPLIVLASLIFVIGYIHLFIRHAAPFILTMGIGGILWLIGNLLWMAQTPLPRLVPWWENFLVLTIAGERLELARMGVLSGIGKKGFLASVGILLAGLIFSLDYPDAGIRLNGVGLMTLSIWLFNFDIAKRTVKQKGLPRFIAVSLLLGYFWLGISGLMATGFGESAGGYRYDATLHSLFLGFVFSMIFGHAPVIFPAISGLALAYSSRFYLHLGLLHLSLLLRIGSDLFDSDTGRIASGVLNALAILLFLGNTIFSLWSGRTVRNPAAG